MSVTTENFFPLNVKEISAANEFLHLQLSSFTVWDSFVLGLTSLHVPVTALASLTSYLVSIFYLESIGILKRVYLDFKYI